jgi:hypothetical protein
MPPLRTYKVFISHAWHRSMDYYRVEAFLATALFFRYENLSVPEHDPLLYSDDELERELRNQMRPADVFLIIGRMYAAHSDWINELSFARRIGRLIIGIWPWGAVNAPLAIRNSAREMVAWNQKSIIRAIRRHAIPTAVYG